MRYGGGSNLHHTVYVVMLHKLVIEFDDRNVDSLGILTKISGVTFDNVPCMLSKNEYSEDVQVHTVYFNPYKVNISVSACIDHKPTLEDILL